MGDSILGFHNLDKREAMLVVDAVLDARAGLMRSAAVSQLRSAPESNEVPAPVNGRRGGGPRGTWMIKLFSSSAPVGWSSSVDFEELK